jgi:hypothetical protein
VRNAAVQFDDDFDVHEPVRRQTSRRSARKNKGERWRRLSRLRFDVRRVGRYGLLGVAALLGTGIVVNALALQKSRHPAPLFGKAITGAELRLPADRPVARAVASAVSQPVAPVPPPKPASAPVEEEAARVPEARTDQIALLLNGAAPTQARPDPKTVLGVQRALVKLGFVLRPNGVFGPQTKKAVELFEKERHLPLKAELDRRLVRILAAESGLKIE